MKTIIPVVIIFSVLLLIPLGYQSVFAGSPPISSPAPYGPDNPPGPPIPVFPETQGFYNFANLIIFDPDGRQQEKHFLSNLSPDGERNLIREQVVNTGAIPITDWHEEILVFPFAMWTTNVEIVDCSSSIPLGNAIVNPLSDDRVIWIDFDPPIEQDECFEIQKEFIVPNSADLPQDFTGNPYVPVLEYPTSQQLDFGDLLDGPHPTFLASNGARHVILPGIHMGVIVDPDADGQPTAGADGDDTDGIDDEEGVFPATLTAGTLVNTVTVLNSVPGDIHIFMAQPPVAGGALIPVGSASPMAPGPTLVSIDLTAFGTGPSDMRVRFCTTADCFDPFGASMSGEVEDYIVNLVEPEQFDWGDLDEPTYPTLASSTGPNHLITGLKMGAFVDAEPDGQPNPTADRDDIVGVDDEDGLTMTSLVAGDASSTITIGSTSAPGIIHVFADKGAGLVPVGSLPVGMGGPHVVPADMTGASAGPIELRVRICDTIPDDCSTPIGASMSGEVEDYIDSVSMAPPTECPPGTSGTPPNCVADPPNPVGGTGIPISTTSLLIAGLDSNYSILMALAVIGFGAFGALYYSTKKKSE